MTKNSIKMTNKTKKINFIDSNPYKINQKSNKKLILFT